MASSKISTEAHERALSDQALAHDAVVSGLRDALNLERLRMQTAMATLMTMSRQMAGVVNSNETPDPWPVSGLGDWELAYVDREIVVTVNMFTNNTKLAVMDTAEWGADISPFSLTSSEADGMLDPVDERNLEMWVMRVNSARRGEPVFRGGKLFSPADASLPERPSAAADDPQEEAAQPSDDESSDGDGDAEEIDQSD